VDRPGRERLLRRVLLGALVVAVLAGGSSVALLLSRDDDTPNNGAASSAAASAPGAHFADPDTAAAFMAGAASDVAAVTTYDYRHLEDALSAGTTVTTGSYRKAFQQALSGQLADKARADHVVHDFDVLDVGVGTISADGNTAKVLVFGRQVVSDRTRTKGEAALITLCATMKREGNRYLIGDLVQDGKAGLPPGSDGLADAAEAARAEVVNVLTYSRSRFDADLRRALAGAAGTLQDQLQANAAATRTAMSKGKYDLSGLVTSLAVKSAAGGTATLLVAAESSRLSDSGAATSVTQVRYEVTVSQTANGWVAGQINTLASG
jgi:hypothetical protein